MERRDLPGDICESPMTNALVVNRVHYKSIAKQTSVRGTRTELKHVPARRVNSSSLPRIVSKGPVPGGNTVRGTGWDGEGIDRGGGETAPEILSFDVQELELEGYHTEIEGGA